ncbi:MAG: FAD-dependent oxidoreductase [Candidatus Thermoplasmatota archaeon]|nr:FAD-dependent oxidoreductase [Candidatus Thermoplasmatota archaeon]
MAEGQRVVVAGAGFAGLNVAKGLQKQAQVTVVAPTDKFVFLPLIHEVLGEKSLPRTVTKDLSEILPDAELIYGRAAKVEGNDLVTTDGQRIPFDTLVLAIGAEPNDFGVPGVAQHALSFYSVGDALASNAMLKHVASELEGQRPLRVRVVGASFTGVEVAGEAADLLDKLDIPREITLHDALPSIFPHQSEDFREAVHEGLKRLGLEVRTEQLVQEVREDGLTVKHGETTEELPADVVFWCAGVRPRTIEGVDAEVRPSLRSTSREDVYVLGDAASFPRDQGVPKLAQTAEDQASIVVHNVLNPDRQQPYAPKVKGLIVSIGDRYAVAELANGPVFKGRVPWHVKRNLYKAKIRMT